MSIATPNPRTSVAAELAPVLGRQYALGWQQTLVCAWFVLLFLFLGHAPLQHVETWRYLSLGRCAMEGSPISDSILPLADGMPMVHHAWLFDRWTSQFALQFGGEFVSGLIAVMGTITMLVWGSLFFQASDRKRALLVSITILWACWFTRIGILGSHLFGSLCCAVLLWIIAPHVAWMSRFRQSENARSLSPGRCLGMAALLLVWVNTSSGYPVAIAVLGSWAAGEIIGRLTRKGPTQSADGQVQVSVGATELAVFMLACTPRGIGGMTESLRAIANPYWVESGGWRPLQLASSSGICFAILIVLGAIALRHSRLRFFPGEIVLFSVLSVFSVVNGALFFWSAPIFLLLLNRHFGDVLTKFTWLGKAIGKPIVAAVEPLTSMHFRFSLICLLLVWCGFALSPISTPLLGGQTRAMDRLHHAETPLAVSAFLRENSTNGLVWAPTYWADWLTWDVQPVQLFTDSRLDLMPRQVKSDYLHILRGDGDWRKTADRYGIQTIVIDKQRQPRLAAEVVRHANAWSLEFEDESAMVVHRRLP